MYTMSYMFSLNVASTKSTALDFMDDNFSETIIRGTHGFAIEVEHGRAEEFLPLRQDLDGAGAGVGRRSVVEGG